MQKILQLVGLLFFFVVQAWAQPEMQNWYFGRRAAVSFATGSPVAVQGSAMTTLEASSSVSDAQGNLLFYTDSETVWNRNNQVMLNGQNFGGNSSGTQGTIIVQNPVNARQYYVFLVPEVSLQNLVGGLRYRIVDMTADGGLGDVGPTTVLFNPTDTKVSERLTAVRHANGRDTWIMIHGFPGNTFYAFLMTPTGISTTPVTSSIGSFQTGGGGNFNTNNSVGHIKASSDGSRLAMTVRNSQFELFNFNNATGIVSNYIPLGRGDRCYGIEFSPDGSRLYGSTIENNSLYQWNLNAGSPAAIASSATLIGTTPARAGGLAKGPDGKIYVAVQGSPSLAVIPNPNALGTACGYLPNGVPLNGNICEFGISNFPNSYGTVVNYWTGNTSTNYLTPSNWNAGYVPSASEDVTIPAASVRMPTLTGIASHRGFTIENGATLTIEATGTLNLSADLLNNGALQGAGTLATNGPVGQFIQGQKVQVGSIKVGAAGVTLATDVSLTNTLVLDGNLVVNSRNLTLLSTAANTAMVVNNGAAAVIGAVNIQRYVGPAKNEALGYRHASAPVVGATVSDLTTTNYSPVTNPDFNTKGAVVRPFPTIYGYNEARVTTTGGTRADFDAGWFSPMSEDELLTPLAGYTLNMPAGETFTFSGVLNNGPMARSGLGRGPGLQSGWHLLGNPYPSPLSWTRAFNGDVNSPGSGATNMDNAVYVFQSSDKYKGSYASYVRGISINGGSDEIAMGQGFFVRTSAAGPPGSLALTNAARQQTYSNPVFQRGNEIRPLVRLVLRGVTATAPDEAVVYFESGATSGFDGAFDAYKLTAGNTASLGLEAGASWLSVNGLPMLNSTTVEVPLRVDVIQAGTFTIEASQLLNLPTGATAWLRDTHTGILTNLQKQQYSFSASPKAQVGRFYLLVGSAPALPAKIAQSFEHISVYPNPARNQVWVRIPSALQNQFLTITLSNVLGQQVSQRLIQNAKGDIQLSPTNLNKGIYTVRIAAATGETTNRRLVVE